MTDLLSNSSAVISDCGLYRYRLDRDYAPAGRAFGPRMAWIMVNPSTADGDTDDATIRKVVGFARRHSCFRVTVGNLFAYRATDVRELKNAADAVGPDNDKHLRRIMADAQCVVVAWGPVAKQPKPLRDRFRRIAELSDGKPLWCFGTANDGHPRHPLMLAYDTPLVAWQPPAQPGERSMSGLSGGRAMLELAERCEMEAEKWHGSHMRAALLDTAKQLRARAADTPSVKP